MNDYVFKMNIDGICGTSFLLSMFDDEIGIMITAGHCLENLEHDQPKEDLLDRIKFDSDIKVIDIINDSEGLDIAILIVKISGRSQEQIWEINKVDDPFSAHAFGFPSAKNSEKKSFECCLEDINYDKSQGLYIGKLNELSDYNKECLMQGMSGAPVFDAGSNKLYGVYIGSQEEEYKYYECRIVPIQGILQFACDKNIIYYKRFNFNEGIGLYDKKTKYYKNCNKSNEKLLNLNKYQHLSFLLIGKSGNGKSSFIKSFLKHSRQLPTTGEGRTTRVNCEYKVLYSQIQEDFECSIDIKFLNKEEFKTLRLKQAYKKIQDYEKNNGDLDKLWDALCKINAFFEVEYLGAQIVDDITSVFEKIFAEYPHTEDMRNQNEEEEKQKTIFEYAEDFYAEMYDILNKRIGLEDRKVILNENIEEADKEFIELCLRTVKKGHDSLTYSGLVKTILITDRVCDEYAGLFEELEIESILFIDTYGLDHQTDDDKEEVTQRLKELLYNTYPNVKNVLYIRKLNANSPEDLEYYLPALYQIDANVILNVVFTEVDKNDNFIKVYKDNSQVDLMEINAECVSGNSAVKYFEGPKKILKYGTNQHPLKESIYNVVKSEAFSESIFSFIKKYLTPYCASENEEEYQKYYVNNYNRLYDLFKAIIEKEYMGTGIIDIYNISKYLEKNCNDQYSNFNKVLEKLMKEFFNKASMRWGNGIYHRDNWRTKQANIDSLKTGRLGYCGVHDDRWSSQFKWAYNAVFTTLEERDFQSLFAENRNSAQGVAIQRLLNESIVDMVGCTKINRDFFCLCNCECKDCDKVCFRKVLLQTYTSNSFEEDVRNRAEWLNDRCDFVARFENNRDDFIDYFRERFKSLRDKFESHNRKLVEDKLRNGDKLQNDILKIRNDVKDIFGEDETKCKDIICKCIMETYLNCDVEKASEVH